MDRSILIKRELDLAQRAGKKEPEVEKASLFDMNNKLNYEFAGNLELYFHRAFCLAKMGKEAEAIKGYELAMKVSDELHPATTRLTYLNSMHLFEALGGGYADKYLEAMEKCIEASEKEAATIKFNDSVYRYFCLKDCKESMESLEKVITCSDDVISRMFVVQQKMDEMKKEFGQYVKEGKPVGLLGFILGSWYHGPVEVEQSAADAADPEKQMQNLQKLQSQIDSYFKKQAKVFKPLKVRISLLELDAVLKEAIAAFPILEKKEQYIGTLQ